MERRNGADNKNAALTAPVPYPKMNAINDIQQKIIDEFDLLDGDREMTLLYIIEMGEKMPPMDEKKKTDENLIKGCQSKVWMSASIKAGKVFFDADSNTAVTKGLTSLLVRIFSGQSPDAILKSNLAFIEAIKMSRFIGTQRSSGLAAIAKQMKLYALAFKSVPQRHG